MGETGGASRNNRLIKAALARFIAGMAILALLLFLSAGSLRWWNAWLFLLSFAAYLLYFGVYLYTRDKGLLQKRLDMKEKEQEQNAYTLLAGLALPLAFVLCGLDHRFAWSRVPTAVVWVAWALMLAGLWLFLRTLMQNRFASRVVEVQQEQRVIDTGVYARVRHPMYSAALLLFFACPIVLGSWWGLLPMLLYLAGIVLRIRNEEKVLRAGLPGYADYMERVRYRLIPYLW